MEFLIIAAIVAALGFAIYYIVQDAKDRGTEWKEKEFSFGGKLLLLLNVLLTFAGAAVTVYMFLDMEDATWAIIAFLVWMVCSVISAYVTSPLRVFVVPSNTSGSDGCAYMIYLPLMMLVMLVSVVLVMLISWIFALMAIFRGVNKGITAALLILLAALVASPWVIQSVEDHQHMLEEQRQEQEEEAEKERRAQLLAAIVQKAESAITVGTAQKLELTEEEEEFVDDTAGNVFAIKEVRYVVAQMLSELYNDKDVMGIFRLTGFLSANNALSRAWNENGVNIGFSTTFLKLIREEVTTNGVFLEESTVCNVYQYGEYEIWLDKDNQFLAVYITHNGARTSVMYSSSSHLKEMVNQYDEENVDYYMVGGSATYTTTSTSNGGTTTQKTGNCSRCSGTGKVTKHYGNSWNKKPGYIYGQKCGACNGTGWVN